VSSFDDMSAAVDALYAAATGQAGWRTALDRVLEATGYTHASVYATDRHVRAAATDSYRLPVTGFWHRHEPSSQREYEAEYYKHELGRHYFIRNPGTRIRHDYMFATEAEMDRSPFYDWAERKGDLRYIMVGQTNPELEVGAALSLQRSRRRGPTTQEEARRLRQLLDHFERAVHLEYHLGKPLAPHVPTHDLLDAAPTGMVLLNGLGRVVLANRAVRAMAAQNDSFSLRADGIAALRPRDNDALSRLIGAALATTAGGGLSSGGVLRLPRRTAKLAYVVIVAPFARRESILSPLMPAACLLITDPEAPPPQSAAALQRLYGLTPRETLLVERLMAGDSPERAAQAMQVTISTARTYLASIFRKTDTNRQSELIRLLLSPPWWALEPPK
jgi:DNA-binding CsgD family transcriptional regulator